MAVTILAFVPVVAFALAPHAPGSLTAAAGQSQPVIARLTWNPSSDAVSYSISAATNADGPYRIVGSSDTTGFDFKDGLGGVSYYFRVAAVNNVGEQSSPAQSDASVTAAWITDPHAPATRATNKCASCHIPHQALASPLMRTEVSTDSPGQKATCLTCHDGKIVSAGNVATGPKDSFALASGHTLDTADSATGLTNDCASCHDPHATATQNPMIPQGTINGNAVSSAGSAWCLACHDDKNSWYGPGYPKSSTPDTDAAGYPVLGTFPGATTYTGAGNAHRLVPETTQTAASGQVVRRDQGDCLYCHAAHRGSGTYDGLVATYRPTTSSTLAADNSQGDYAALCFKCHGGATPSGFATAPVDIKRIVTGGGAGAGHKIVTAGGLLPVGAPLPCYECHNPHGSNRGNNSLISDVRGESLTTTGSPLAVRRFCFTCHTTSDTGEGWDSAAATYTPVAVDANVVGIARNGGVLMLPANINGHTRAAGTSCYSCHGSDYGDGGSNVHSPDLGGGNTAHAFTSGSDVVADGDAGCTNSGSGCHGTDATRVSFAAYHPNAGCTAGACHTSPSKPTYSGNGDCQSCHDGSFDGAPVRAALVTEHYSETTHTASGLGSTVSAGGSASAMCTTCHDPSPAVGPRGLAGQHTNITPTLGSPYGSTISCVDCHSDTRANGTVQVLAKWTNHACSDCHSIASSAPQHGATAPVVNTTSADGCGSTGSSCHTTYDVHALHKNAAGGCTLAGCHDSSQQAAKPILKTCGQAGGATGCHAEKTTTNHGGTHTLNAAGSAYDNAAITGCTGAGAGCHGDAPATYQAIHPNSGCTSGPCHTAANHNDAAFDDPNTCQNCHGGGAVNYDHAPDVVALTDASPAGHYSETTHTATPASSVSAGGTYSATCTTCHNPVNPTGIDGLYNQHQGLDTLGSTTCADCHNANAAIQGIVTDTTRTDTCAACHTAAVLPTMVQHGTSAPTVLGVEKPGITACARIGCHATLDLHELHKSNVSGNANGCTMAGCHDPAKQGSKPTATSCGVGGACHTGDPHSPAAHLTLASEQCVACHVAGGDLKQVHPRGCTTCHNNPAYPSLPAGKRECVSCHVSGIVGTHAYSPADQANHYNETRHTALDSATGGFACSDCHSLSLAPEHEVVLPQGNLSADGTVTCVECHNDPYAKQVINSQWELSADPQNWHECNDCHTDAGLGTKHDTRFSGHAAIENTSCDGGSCHGSAVLGLNDIETIHANAADGTGRTSCLVCHTNGADTALAGSSCGVGGSCHTDKVAGNHGSATAHTFSAASDYNNTTVSGCTNSGVGCHNVETTYASFAAYHPSAGCLSGVCHTSPSKANYNGNHECVSCHNGSFVGAPANTPLHAPAGLGHYSETTHTATGLAMTVSAGGSASATCNDCHNATNLGNSDVRQLYNQHQGLPAPYVDTTCKDCHNKNVQVTSVVRSKWPTKRCDACHNSAVLGVGFEQHGATAPVITATAGTYALTGQTCLTAGCHSTSNLHAIHKDAAGGCALAGCHNFSAQAVLPIGASCGATGTCHTGTEPHNATLLSTAHNGSSVALAQPGGTVTPASATVLLSENFGTTTTWPAVWTRSSTTLVTNQTGSARSGAAAEIGVNTTRTEYDFYRDFDLTGYSTADLSFWYQVNVSNTSDFLVAEYSTNGGANYSELFRRNTDALTWSQATTMTVPAGGTVRVRFRGTFNATGEYGRVDDVTLIGKRAASTTPLPVNSTALVSCQNNPSGTECHSVSDVRTLHAATVVRCAACHIAGGPTNNCQTAACHSTQYINVDVHNAANHATNQISTAAGQPFSGTGVTSTTCTGCHDDSISLEHGALSAYSSTPCSMCHKKTVNSGAPTIVTASDTQATIVKPAGTALCTDCHKTVTAVSPHVQRQGTTATPGSAQFDPSWSGHKSYATMPGSLTSIPNVQGATRTWTLPTAASWLKTGWTTTTQSVGCADCHGSVAGAVGPHGSSMAVNIASGYDNSYSTGTLTLSGSTMSNATNICAKCHTTTGLNYNNVHSTGNHSGQPCTACHVKTPHAWKRPRLIGYTTDPAPYRATQVTSIRAKNYAPTAWTKTDCGAGCTGEHPTITGTSLWP